MTTEDRDCIHCGNVMERPEYDWCVNCTRVGHLIRRLAEEAKLARRISAFYRSVTLSVFP